MDAKFFSTPASETTEKVVRPKLYETEKVVKYVHVPQPTPDQARTGNTAPKEGNLNYVPNPIGRMYQESIHTGRLVSPKYFTLSSLN